MSGGADPRAGGRFRSLAAACLLCRGPILDVWNAVVVRTDGTMVHRRCWQPRDWPAPGPDVVLVDGGTFGGEREIA